MTRDQREDVEGRFESSTTAAARMFAEHSADALTRRPREDSWSAAECVAHLSLTAAASAPLVEEAVADLRARGRVSDAPDRMDWLGRLLRWTLEPPPRLRTGTAAPFQPQRVEPLDEVLSEFRRQQSRLLAALRSAEGLVLSARKVVSPFDSRVRYNAYAMFRILETHERRHLWQAQRAVSSTGPGPRREARDRSG